MGTAKTCMYDAHLGEISMQDLPLPIKAHLGPNALFDAGRPQAVHAAFAFPSRNRAAQKSENRGRQASGKRYLP